MRRYAVVTAITILTLGSALLAVLSGCKEKDVYLIPDEKYIVDYLGHNANAKELFRVDGLFNSTPYTLPFDSAVVTDRVLGHSRDIVVDVSKGKVDHGILGEVKDALVHVTDSYTLEVSRAYTVDTLVDTIDVDLNRQAFFVQAGDNTRLYSGWILWRVDYIGSVGRESSVTVKSSTGFFVNGLGDTVEVRDIDTVTMGTRLKVTTSWGGDSLSVCHLLSDYDQSGGFTRPMVRYYNGHNYDSLSFVTPTDSLRYFNEFMIQTINPLFFPNRSVVIVPYVLK